MIRSAEDEFRMMALESEIVRLFKLLDERAAQRDAALARVARLEMELVNKPRDDGACEYNLGWVDGYNHAVEVLRAALEVEP